MMFEGLKHHLSRSFREDEIIYGKFLLEGVDLSKEVTVSVREWRRDVRYSGVKVNSVDKYGITISPPEGGSVWVTTHSSYYDLGEERSIQKDGVENLAFAKRLAFRNIQSISN